MARAGIYFSDVKKARDTLVSQGRHPSIDAVREALGNTGSKTTIHRYLRELEAEEGGPKVLVSDAILAIVGQLSERLQDEAAVQVEVLRAQLVQQQEADAQARGRLDSELEQARHDKDEMAQQADLQRRQASELSTQLGQEQVARQIAEKHAADLLERLADAQRHQASLEEKHMHARDALEHFRSSAKEQREQEGRRHEQQVQALQLELRQAQLASALKQEESTRLSKDAAALAAEIRTVKQTLHDEREARRDLAKKLEKAQESQARVTVLDAQLVEIRGKLAQSEQACARTEQLHEELRLHNMSLQKQLGEASHRSTLEARLAKLDAAVFGTGGPEPEAKDS